MFKLGNSQLWSLLEGIGDDLQDPTSSPFDRLFEIGVIEDDVRALAPEFQADCLQIGFGSRLLDLPTSKCASCECDLHYLRVLCNGASTVVTYTSEFSKILNNVVMTRKPTIAVDDVDHTGWESSLGDEVGHLERGEGGQLGGLHMGFQYTLEIK